MTVGFQQTPLPRDTNAKEIQGVFRVIGDGTQTVVTAGTRVQLSATSTECKRIDVTAADTNANVVVIGGSTVVAAANGRRGISLQPSSTYTFYPTDLSDVYIDAVTSGDKVSYIYFA